MSDRTVSVGLQLRTAGFTSALRTAQQATKKFGDDLQSQARKNKDSFDDVSRGLAGIGLAAGVGVGLAVKKFADFDAQMSKVRAATHETTGNMNLLRDAALEAGKRTAFSATEAAAAIENLAKAGVTTTDILNGGLNGALDLAAAGQLDVAQAAETAATAMTQFKLSGKDVPHIADLLAAAAGKAQGEVTDMAQALNQSGLVAAQMGLSIEETTGTLAAFASAGLLGSDAGTSFKTMLLRLANPSKEAAATLEGLGVSAYDVQGGFVGIGPLAEQLRTKLSKLSQEQRDAALAQIFGSDAIRAAAILYSQGAKGIAEWTTKVNDAGFAAETAAIKQDNLRGDVEKLGGSFETALIKSGSGANDSLRGLAQGATAVVDGFAGLPEQVQQGAVALGAIVAISGLGAAGLLKTASAAGEAKAAWQGLGRTGRTLTLSMGAVGVAITAGLALYGLFAKRNADAAAKAEDLRSTLDEQTGAITGNTRAYVANDLAQSGLAQRAKDLGLSLVTVTDAALGNKVALDAVVRSLDSVIEAGTSTEIIANELHSSMTAEAQAATKLKADLLGTNEALTDAQQKQRLAAEGAAGHTSAQSLQAEAVKKANTAFRAQKEDLDSVIESMHRASGAALSLSGAQIKFQAALDDAVEGIKDHGRTLDINTEKGRSNRAALDEVAAAANDQTDALLKSGKGHATAAKSAQLARAEFIRIATRMGLNKTQADRLARALIDIPDKAHTAITNTAPAAKRSVDTYRTKGLGSIPATVPTKVITTGIPTAKQEIAGFTTYVDKSLGGIADEAVRVSFGVSRGAPLGRPILEKRATGGPVFGAGSDTSDSIPALLSNGEHVLTAREVQAAGGHGAVEAWRDSLVRGYAKGGRAEVAVHASTPTAKAIGAVTSSIAREFGAEIAKQLAAGPGGPPGQVSTFRGHRLNARTIGMVLDAERMLGRQFHITQGSYSTRVAASGSTHAGGGVLDTNGPGGWNAAVTALRRAGFAAWHRTPSQGPWGHHIHSVAKGDPTASAAAKAQVRDFQRGGDGLGGRSKGGRVVRSFAAGGRVGFATGGPVGLAGIHRIEVDPLVKKIARLEKAFETAADKIETTTDRIKAMVEQRNEFGAAAASSFTGPLFGSGTSTADLKLRLDARRNDAKGLQKNLQILRQKGLNKGLWAQLAQSSDYGAAQQLAQMTPAQLAAISQSFVASQQATAGLAAYAGNVQYGGQIANAQAQLRREQSTVKAIRAALNGARVRVVQEGGKSYMYINTKS